MRSRPRRPQYANENGCLLQSNVMHIGILFTSISTSPLSVIGANSDLFFIDWYLYSYSSFRAVVSPEKRNTQRYFSPLILRSAISMHKFRFGDYADRIYPTEFKIKDTSVIPHIQLGLLLTLTYIQKITVLGTTLFNSVISHNWYGQEVWSFHSRELSFFQCNIINCEFRSIVIRILICMLCSFCLSEF